jgi:hypothetical protein
MFMKPTITILTAILLALCSGNVPAAPQAGNQVQDVEMAGYHYLGSIGKCFAEANLKMLESRR